MIVDMKEEILGFILIPELEDMGEALRRYGKLHKANIIMSRPNSNLNRIASLGKFKIIYIKIFIVTK
jgi:hypothetical protein